MTPEKQFENNLIRELKKIGVFAHHFDAVGCDGWPDIICLKNNECILIECKYHTTTLRDEQFAFHQALKVKYGFDRIYEACKLDHQYVLIDSCFYSYQYKFILAKELAAAIAKEFGDDRIPQEAD